MDVMIIKKNITKKLKSRVNIFGKSISMLLFIACILTLILLASTGIAVLLSSGGTLTGTMTVITPPQIC